MPAKQQILYCQNDGDEPMMKKKDTNIITIPL